MGELYRLQGEAGLHVARLHVPQPHAFISIRLSSQLWNIHTAPLVSLIRPIIFLPTSS